MSDESAHIQIALHFQAAAPSVLMEDGKALFGGMISAILNDWNDLPSLEDE